MLVLCATSIRIILNSISPIPPIGTRSLPVVNNRNFFFNSNGNDVTTSQKYLRPVNRSELCTWLLKFKGVYFVFAIKTTGASNLHQRPKTKQRPRCVKIFLSWESRLRMRMDFNLKKWANYFRSGPRACFCEQEGADIPCQCVSPIAQL